MVLRRLVLGLTVLWLCGCHLMWVRTVDLNWRLTNDSNELLTLEGTGNLPDGAVLEARLMENGRRWAQGRGVVQGGRYFIVLEISRCPGFRPLDLQVIFDPVLAGSQVQRYTGARGEALAGNCLVELGDRRLLIKSQKLVLTMSARQALIRRLQRGDGDIDELHSYLARHPNDAESLIGLGLAFLKQRPSQHYVNSEAYRMLVEGIKAKPAATALEMEARLWVARLDEKAAREAAERERQKGPSYSSVYVDNVVIRPGLALGAFELGMGYQFLSMSFHLLPTSQAGQYTLQELPGFVLSFDPSSGLLVRASTTDVRYRTQNGLGPGLDVSELKRLFPDLSLSYSPVEIRADGRAYANCTVTFKGMNLLIERSYDPEFPLPEEVVHSVEVFKVVP